MTGPAAEGMIPGCEDDVALVVRTLAGDRAAFGALVDRYEEPVRRVARAVLHDVHDADALNKAVWDSLQAEVQKAGDRPDPGILFARMRPKLNEGREHIRRALERARG